MSVRGIFASHSSIVGDRVGDFASGVLMLGYSGMAPLLALSSGMPKKSASDTSFSWTEDMHISGNAEVTANANAAATTLAVDSASIWVNNSILMNQTTGEYMLVTAINSETSINVLRGIAGTTAQGVTDGDKLQLIGSAYAEAGGKPDPVAQKGESRTNYVQIFKNGWAISGTARAVAFRSGNQLAANKQLAVAYHAEDLERSYIFGRPSISVKDGKQFRTSAGIVYQLETYGGIVEEATVGANAGQMNLDGLRNFIRRIFDKNAKGLPNERIAYCGSSVVELIDKMVRLDTTYRITEGETAYGIKVLTLRGFNGDIKLMTHPLFVENPVWGAELHIYHPGLLAKRTLRDTWTETFSPASNTSNGEDADSGYVAVEQGWEVRGAETMGIMRGIETAVAS